MSAVYKQIDSDATLLKFGQRFQWHGKTGTVGATTEKDGRTIAADFQHDGVVERILLEKGHAPPARRAAPRNDSNRIIRGDPGTSIEELADGVVDACKQYVDVALGRKFAGLTSAITELLESHQKRIADDVEELRSLQTKYDVIEARLALLESRRP